MRQHRRVRLALVLGGGLWAIARCGGSGTTVTPPPPVSECADSVQLTVTFADTVPVFSWTPDCTTGRLLVEEGIDEYWGTETFGQNIYRSPIVYNINPPGSAPEELARPLEIGHRYRATLFRWVTYTPAESVQVVGVRYFTR